MGGELRSMVRDDVIRQSMMFEYCGEVFDVGAIFDDDRNSEMLALGYRNCGC